MCREHNIFSSLFMASPVLTASFSPLEAAGREIGPLWLILVLAILCLAMLMVLALLALLLWWLSRRPKKMATRPGEAEAPAPVAEAEPPARMAEVEALAPVVEAPEPEPAPPTPDNLQRIEGIGPKIASILRAAGIMTFAQLAASDVDRLREILTEAGIARLADPTTWPEQASLAAEGKWEALESMQDGLVGGRRV
jgi:predicted flap endonuclease-1-like 5' DNA nuclease